MSKWTKSISRNSWFALILPLNLADSEVRRENGSHKVFSEEDKIQRLKVIGNVNKHALKGKGASKNNRQPVMVRLNV